MSKYTDWFPANVKPCRVGVYQVRRKLAGVWIGGLNGGAAYAHWNGKEWAWAEMSVKAADFDRRTRGADQDKRWRGLTKPAKA